MGLSRRQPWNFFVVIGFALMIGIHVLATRMIDTYPPNVVTRVITSENVGVLRPNDQMIVAFYYPWYAKNQWNRHGTHGHYPLLGNYSSDDTALAEQHIDWAVDRGGIDAWAVSWWNEKSPGAKRFVDGMLSAKNIDKIKFCMVYEAIGALPTRDFTNGTIALDKFISDMKYFRESYFSHSSYLRTNGRPVVYLYITRSYLNFDPSMLKTIKTAVGENILFIADEPYYKPQDAPETAKHGVRNGVPVFEAYTSYNMYQFSRVHEGEKAVDYMFREALPIYNRWSRETVFFPHVLPKYHDFREGHPQVVGDSEGLMTQLKTFACLPRPSWYSKEFPDLMFVTSFNEWWEGSSVEPDMKQEYGFMYLDTIKAFKESGVWAKCQQSVA